MHPGSYNWEGGEKVKNRSRTEKKLIRLLESCSTWKSPEALIQTKLLTKGDTR